MLASRHQAPMNLGLYQLHICEKFINNDPQTTEHKQESLSMSGMSSLLCSWPGKYPCAAFPQDGITHTSPQTCSLLAGFRVPSRVFLFDFPVKDLSRAEMMRMNAALLLSILGFGLLPFTLRPGCFLNSTLRDVFLCVTSCFFVFSDHLLQSSQTNQVRQNRVFPCKELKSSLQTNQLNPLSQR